MLTTTPYLRVRRPSPTAAEFTVSTRPPMTLPLHLLLGAVYLARVLTGLSVLLLLTASWSLSPYASAASSSSLPSDNNDDQAPSLFSTAHIHHLLHALSQTAPGRLAARIASSRTLPPYVLLPLCLAALYALTLRIHTEESVLVLRGLGIQTSSSKATYLGGGPATRFIPTAKIQDVLVNEAFHGFEVRCYLAVAVEGEEDVVVVFPKLLPRPRVVERVWRGVRECLFEGDGAHGGLEGKVQK
ncbi:hypothetical protein F5Y15DRAFT_58691 [Xylariaceae sp. FL0016]|nr:hypothetical protein F5Y15DRAFT_58691 [Xylariaceae sp. FL0016]